jgi:hypothetical protein
MRNGRDVMDVCIVSLIFKYFKINEENITEMTLKHYIAPLIKERPKPK